MAKDSGDLLGTSPEFLGAAWFDPIEAVIRDRVRGFIENLVEAELDDALGRSRYQRAGAANVASGTAGSVNILSSLTQAGEARDWRCDHSQFYAVTLEVGTCHDLDLPTSWEPIQCSDPEKANPHHGGIRGVVELCRSDTDRYENAITELAGGSEVLPECLTPRLRIG